jgi:hypothetical protein
MTNKNIRSGARLPFISKVKLTKGINDFDTRQEIKNKMVAYERKLRKIAMMYNINSINKLPKSIYDSKIITALKKIRDNSSVSTMGVGKIPTPGLPDGPVIIDPVSTGTAGADPLNAMTRAVSMNIDNKISAMNELLDSILSKDAAMEATGRDLDELIKKINAKEKESEDERQGKLEEKSVDLDEVLTDDFLNDILTKHNNELTDEERNGLRKYLMNFPGGFRSIKDLLDEADDAVENNLQHRQEDIKRKADDLQKRIDAEDAKDAETDRSTKGKNKKDFEGHGDGDEQKHIRPPDDAKTDQLIPDGDPKKTEYLIKRTGAISRRLATGEEQVYMMDGTWKDLDPNTGRVTGRQYFMTRTRTGQWRGLPSSIPRGAMIDHEQEVDKENDDRRKPIPPDLKPIPKDKPPKDEDPPIPPIPIDPRDPKKDKTVTPVVFNPDDKNRTSGISMLRPFFNTYHGLDLLTQTDKEAIQDIKEYDLFDLPIPENDTLENPLFEHQLKQQMFRFEDESKPTPQTVRTVIQKEIFGVNLDGSLTRERIISDYKFYNVRAPPTQNPVDIQNQHNIPTVLGGLKDGVPFRDPNNNDYSRGLGEAERTAASYPESVMESLYTNPDIYNSLVSMRNPFQ